MGVRKHLLLRTGGLSGRMSVELSAAPKRDSDSSINAAIEGGGAHLVISFSHLRPAAIREGGLSEALT